MSLATGAYSLSVFGLTATQRMVLASLCKLSRNRGVSYVLPDSSAESSVDIVIVDWDNRDAVETWKNSSIQSSVPVVFVSGQPLTGLDTQQYNLVKSHLSGSLLQLLDRVAISELSHQAPLIVSDDAKVQGGICNKGSHRGTANARALVIDDSLSVRTQMSICLEKLEIASEMAEDAQQGLEKVQQRHYDLVFLDVMLPDMDGYQVCKLIKKDPRTQRVPVVMLTSKGSAINRLQGSIAGCDRYLIKPATEQDVRRVANELLPAAPQEFFLHPVKQH